MHVLLLFENVLRVHVHELWYRHDNNQSITSSQLSYTRTRLLVLVLVPVLYRFHEVIIRSYMYNVGIVLVLIFIINQISRVMHEVS